MNRMFPKISYDSLCQPRTHGGLSILDPLRQQAALQLRWLEPLFALSQDSSYITTCLCHHLLVTASCYTDPRFVLVFPAARPSTTKATDSVAYLLVKAVDFLPINWMTASLSAATVLHLPLNTIWDCTLGNESHHRPGFASMTVSDLFTFDHTLGFLRRRTAMDGIFRPILTTRFFSDLAADRICLKEHFAKLCLPMTHPGGGHTGSLGLVDGTPLTARLAKTLPLWRPRAFWHIVSSPHLPTPVVAKSSWRLFWRWPMEHTARNIWYRTLHHTLPTADRLFRFGVSGVPSANCRLCEEAVDTTEHFLVQCRKKWAVWRTVWSTLYYAEPQPRTLIHFIRTLQLPASTPTIACPNPPQALTVACTLQAIWHAYWRFIFDDDPFFPVLVAARALALIDRFRRPPLL